MQTRRIRRRAMRFARNGVAVAVAALSLVALAATAGATGGVTSLSCFGAASRDPHHTCVNPKLKFEVSPTPHEAELVPNAPCTPLEPVVNACGFGVSAQIAKGTIALVGNSHAAHWRAALAVVAERLGLAGVSLTRSSCPFTHATISLPEPERAECAGWNRNVVSWFEAHPEVGTVFVSDQPTTPVVPRGRSVLGAEVAGYVEAWAELPASLTHVVVIRDNPYARGNTLACVEAAIAKHQDAGLACAVPRSQAVKTDPAVLAAQQLHSPRVQVIDMTRFFCDSRLCYPVIGGALVYRDADHLTRVFAGTLGPFLLTEVQKLMVSWGQG